MVPLFRILFLISFYMAVASSCFCQSFEGSITLHVISDQGDNTSTLKVKDNKSIREVEVDSSESITIIKDWSSETSTLLKKKNGLKYGFILHNITESAPPVTDENKKQGDLTTDVTDEVKMIGSQKCVKVIIKNSFGLAEAWITKEISFPLSKYFPEFLGSNTDPHLYDLRLAADRQGFVMSYWEKPLNSEKAIHFDISLVTEEIPNEEFHINKDYIVLDEEGMKRLYQDAQTNESDKKHWEEFMQLFGK